MNQSAGELSSENLNTMSPMDFNIDNAYPNPFNNTIKIDYSLEKRGHVDIEIFDTNGKWIKNLVGNVKPSGSHVVTWSGEDDNGNIFSSGTYLVVIRFGTRMKSKKINLIK
jgi:flagellar hook assembly protein FlgD